MQATRRGFLGLFGAGAVAGPKLAAGIAQNVAADSMPLPPMGGYAAGQAVKEDTTWRLRRIADLKKIISGKDPEAERNRKMQRLHYAENGERVRLDGLRSISPVHKQRMLVNGVHGFQERIRRADAGFSLAQLLNGED